LKRFGADNICKGSIKNTQHLYTIHRKQKESKFESAKRQVSTKEKVNQVEKNYCKEEEEALSSLIS